MAGYSYMPMSAYSYPGVQQRTNPLPDADSRRGPRTSYYTVVNGESYLMTVETTIERVHPSIMPTKNGVAGDRVQMDLTPTQLPSMVPTNNYDAASDRLHPHSYPTRPPVVEDFLNHIQTEVSRPSLPGVSRSPYGFPLGTPPPQSSPVSPVNCGELVDNTPKPKLGFVWPSQNRSSPVMMTPSPPRPDTQLSKPLSDIDATDYLKKLSKPSALDKKMTSTPENLAPGLAAVSNGSAAGTIDSREASRRYKNAITSPQPYAEESNIPMIDSKTAKEKYNGVFIKDYKGLSTLNRN